MQEFSLIKNFFKQLSNKKNGLNLADDCAKLSVKLDHDLIVSKDMVCQDIHFNFSDGPRKIASKLLRSNLSDIAASGGIPKYYMLGFTKSKKINSDFVKKFSQELSDIQKQHKITLIGGDTISSSSKLFYSVTIFAEIKKGCQMLRSNAKNNDLIFVTGNIGDSYVGFNLKNKNKFNKNIPSKIKKYFIDRHFSPEININFCNFVAEKKISRCAIDISDGILADLKHICTESNLGAIIYKERIPISENLKIFYKDINYKKLISFGEDHEIIFSVNPKNKKRILNLAKKLKIKLTYIGVFTNKSNDLILLDSKNKSIKISKYGYEH